MSEKKIGKKILLVILIIVLVLLVAIGGLFAFSSLDKKKSLAMVPHDYSVYVHTDSAWAAVEPLLDLEAVDMFLSTPDLAPIRGAFMQLRASEWRNNKVLSFLASKSIDAALYNDESNDFTFLACVDLKGLSAASRLAPAYMKIFKPEIEGLTFENGIFVYQTDSSAFYVKAYKNLVIASNNFELLQKSLEANHGEYSKKDLQVIKQKTDEPIQIIVNAKKLLKSVQSEGGIVKELLKVIPEDGLSSISFKVTDDDIRLQAHVPFELNADEELPLTPVLQKRSTTPSILSRFRENVQYYTILNAGTLEQLKNSFLPLFVNDAKFTWDKYNGLSKAALSITLDDLLFSWSGNEVVIFGIENRNDPVFAIQIKDEKQRQKVFEKFLSSILVRDNSSLILDGIRIPRIELPAFLQDFLSIFGVSLPKPYYLIQDGFIYFTESPENLSEIHKSENKIGKISADENWAFISKDLSSEATMSLYYNLERSVPFFLKSNANLAKVLALYSIGRTDFSINDSEFVVQLSAISKRNDKSGKIAGFPFELKGKVDGELVAESDDPKAKNNALYWVENKHKLVSMEIPSTTVTEFDISDTAFICPCRGKNIQPDKAIWVITGHGAVYLMNRKFEAAKDYPILLNDNISVRPAVVNNGLYICTESGRFVYVDYDGTTRDIEISLMGSVKATPSVYEFKDGKKIIALYDKSFFGKVQVIEDWEEGRSFVFDVSGISYGSPAFLGTKNDLPKVAFITQNGNLYIWDLQSEECEQKQIPGMYKTNVVSMEDCFYVLSTAGVLTKVPVVEEEPLSVQLPGVTCNEAFVTVNNSSIYVCPDSNVIYGFDKNLELIYPFPVKGWGRPAFGDINGDKKTDCFTLSVDNKLYAISLR